MGVPRIGDGGVVTEDVGAGKNVQAWTLDAVFGNRDSADSGDNVVYDYVIVIKDDAEVRNKARLQYYREGEGFRFLRLKIHVTAVLARDA